MGRTTSQNGPLDDTTAASTTIATATAASTTNASTAVVSSKSASTLGALAKKKKIEIGPANAGRGRAAASKVSNGTTAAAAATAANNENAAQEGPVDGRKTSRLTGKKRSISEESTASSSSAGDEDALSGSAAKKLKTEVEKLRAENKVLMGDQLSRETEIRIEVSEEMAMRSAHLLEQIQDLQSQLAEKERDEARVMYVTRSCKKVRRKQLDQANEELAHDLEEAEEELNRVKNKYDLEILQLKETNARLEAEVAEWRRKAEKLSSVMGGGDSKGNMMPVEDVENAYRHTNIPANEQSRYSRSPGPNLLRSPLAPISGMPTDRSSVMSNLSPKSRGLAATATTATATASGASKSNWEQTLRNGGRSNSPVRFVAGGNNASISPLKSSSPVPAAPVPVQENNLSKPKKGPVNPRAIAAAAISTEANGHGARSTRSRTIRA